MYTGQMVFSQLMEQLPWHTFRRCVKRYDGEHKVKKFRCSEQFRCMAFAQLTQRESLRDIETCLRAQANKLSHLGLGHGMSRNTLANANRVRDWRIYADFCQGLIQTAQGLPVSKDLDLPSLLAIYALDFSVIDLSLTLFRWAHFRRTKAAVKLHALLDLQRWVPAFIHISEGKLHDVNVLDLLLPEAGAVYIMDRAYLDFPRLRELDQAGAFFILRAKSNTQLQRQSSRPVDRSTGLICDQVVRLTGVRSAKAYPDQIRRVRYRDRERNKTLVFLSNNFSLPALSIVELYRQRWQVELFFKWIKQHLRIKAFYGTSANAVKTQIWIAVAVYVLIATLRERWRIEASLYTILQILSLTVFEKVDLYQLLRQQEILEHPQGVCMQLNLLD